MSLAERWLRNAWALTWGLIVLATALLTLALIESSAWLQLVTLASTGFYAIRAIETFKGAPP